MVGATLLPPLPIPTVERSSTQIVQYLQAMLTPSHHGTTATIPQQLPTVNSPTLPLWVCGE